MTINTEKEGWKMKLIRMWFEILRVCSFLYVQRYQLQKKGWKKFFFDGKIREIAEKLVCLRQSFHRDYFSFVPSIWWQKTCLFYFNFFLSLGAYVCEKNTFFVLILFFFFSGLAIHDFIPVWVFLVHFPFFLCVCSASMCV